MPAHLVARLVIGGAFATLTACTWNTWPDVVIDFGRELYVPWQITRGAVLYRDVAYFNGPLSPYVNAIMFELFGAGMRTLFLANLGWLALFTFVLHRMLLGLSDALSALFATLVFLFISAFGLLAYIGNYNFVAPYSHEMTHGFMLGVLALVALRRWSGRRSPRWLVVAGVSVGLALLTKPETALAALCGGGVAVFCSYRQGTQPQRPLRVLAIFSGAVVAPSVVAIGLFTLAMPLSDACLAVATPWRSLTSTETTSLALYRRMSGLDQPVGSLLALLQAVGLWWLALLPALVLALTTKTRRGAVAASGLLLAGLTAAWQFWPAGTGDPWGMAARALPVWSLGIFVFAAWRVWLGSVDLRLSAIAGFAAFTTTLLGKMALNARVEEYGFVLAAPALVLAFIALSHWIPVALDNRGAQGRIVRLAAFALAVGFCAGQVERTAPRGAERPVEVGHGPDAFRADARGVPINRALAALEATPPGSTVAVLPEGVMLNFLAKRANPTRFISFMPPELLLFGERAIVDDFAAHPPDWIVLVHRLTGEYDLPVFGRDYATSLLAWVHQHYRPLPPFGDAPFSEQARFGVQLWTKR